MSTTRIPYENLPPAALAAIEATTGPIASTEATSEGWNSAVAAKLHTATGTYFVKALPSDHRRVWTQQREADVAPYVRFLAPALTAHTVTSGWHILIFEALPGHHADYRPGSADLPKVADLIRRIGELPAPPIELRDATQRLAAYVTHDDDLQHFAGNTLLHTDWNPSNLIIGDDTRIVDWGWATRGAPWLDTAYWTIWLIAAGHTPASAEQHAAQIPSWQTTSTAGLNAFAAANTRLWTEISGDRPDPWTKHIMTAAQDWYEFRLRQSTDA
ncbi:phosphotransferase [Dactylosporangium sp. NBC_01737]|uniref:phosphotransferase n=1 Tax=Dactylosporangium sp. NBC_01737 TaxID=2975959 RepID=UPI002E0D92E7|nr:phosphotransferase [Dactylosporangium sp. NBC_01737]